MRVFVLLTGLGLLAATTMAQPSITNTCPADAPISIQLALSERGSGYADATITNKSDRPVTAVS